MTDSIDDIKKEKIEQLQNEEPDVEIFTTPTCPYCRKLKQWLDREGIAYTEHNVAENRKKAKEMIQRTGQQGVPQTFIGDQTIIGFQPAKIKQALSS
ncbi:MAG: glutaredoxin family protein [Candidatus Nanohaloarchaea archaeon]|nr:glutaredoxin family protein [Candidatus Nanohaloarchaea archaeon]